MKSTKLFSWFRKVAFVEGISYIVLLGIAMPLKYMADMPKAVTVVGGLHGALFVGMMALAWESYSQYRKSFSWFVKVFVSSLVPFGTFVLDREWKKEEAELKAVGH